jgi:solute carrier family 25 (mitochondrial thiamine pyrophosphate transporter), member 19
VRKEGLGALWKGNTAGVCLYASYNSVQFLVFDYMKGHSTNPLIGGSMAALVATSVTYPFDLIRTRMTLAKNSGMFKYVYGLLRGSEGPAGLFKGYLLTASQVVPYMGCVFAVHAQLSQKWKVSDFVSGSAAGFVCKSAFMPVDVFRRRLQLFKAQPEEFNLLGRDSLAYAQSSKDRFELLRRMWRLEGFRAFYRGWSLAVLKSAPATGITFAVHGFVKEFLEKY